MNRDKFQVGDRVEVQCTHLRDGQRVQGWAPGVVVEADHRMAAVRFETDVFSSNGWPIADRILWCAHGSRNLRRVAAEQAA
jgi:hypothetical protein